MRRNWKRILSLLLTVAMVFTMNTSVFAATDYDSSNLSDDVTFADGDTYTAADGTVATYKVADGGTDGKWYVGEDETTLDALKAIKPTVYQYNDKYYTKDGTEVTDYSEEKYSVAGKSAETLDHRSLINDSGKFYAVTEENGMVTKGEEIENATDLEKALAKSAEKVPEVEGNQENPDKPTVYQYNDKYYTEVGTEVTDYSKEKYSVAEKSAEDLDHRSLVKYEVKDEDGNVTTTYYEVEKDGDKYSKVSVVENATDLEKALAEAVDEEPKDEDEEEDDDDTMHTSSVLKPSDIGWELVKDGVDKAIDDNSKFNYDDSKKPYSVSINAELVRQGYYLKATTEAKPIVVHVGEYDSDGKYSTKYSVSVSGIVGSDGNGTGQAVQLKPEGDTTIALSENGTRFFGYTKASGSTPAKYEDITEPDWIITSGGDMGAYTTYAEAGDLDKNEIYIAVPKSNPTLGQVSLNEAGNNSNEFGTKNTVVYENSDYLASGYNDSGVELTYANYADKVNKPRITMADTDGVTPGNGSQLPHTIYGITEENDRKSITISKQTVIGLSSNGIESQPLGDNIVELGGSLIKDHESDTIGVSYNALARTYSTYAPTFPTMVKKFELSLVSGNITTTVGKTDGYYYLQTSKDGDNGVQKKADDSAMQYTGLQGHTKYWPVIRTVSAADTNYIDNDILYVPSPWISTKYNDTGAILTRPATDSLKFVTPVTVTNIGKTTASVNVTIKDGDDFALAGIYITTEKTAPTNSMNSAGGYPKDDPASKWYVSDNALNPAGRIVNTPANKALKGTYVFSVSSDVLEAGKVYNVYGMGYLMDDGLVDMSNLVYSASPLATFGTVKSYNLTFDINDEYQGENFEFNKTNNTVTVGAHYQGYGNPAIDPNYATKNAFYNLNVKGFSMTIVSSNGKDYTFGSDEFTSVLDEGGTYGGMDANALDNYLLLSALGESTYTDLRDELAADEGAFVQRVLVKPDGYHIQDPEAWSTKGVHNLSGNDAGKSGYKFVVSINETGTYDGTVAAFGGQEEAASFGVTVDNTNLYAYPGFVYEKGASISNGSISADGIMYNVGRAKDTEFPDEYFNYKYVKAYQKSLGAFQLIKVDSAGKETVVQKFATSTTFPVSVKEGEYRLAITDVSKISTASDMAGYNFMTAPAGSYDGVDVEKYNGAKTPDYKGTYPYVTIKVDPTGSGKVSFTLTKNADVPIYYGTMSANDGRELFLRSAFDTKIVNTENSSYNYMDADNYEISKVQIRFVKTKTEADKVVNATSENRLGTFAALDEVQLESVQAGDTVYAVMLVKVDGEDSDSQSGAFHKYFGYQAATTAVTVQKRPVSFVWDGGTAKTTGAKYTAGQGNVIAEFGRGESELLKKGVSLNGTELSYFNIMAVDGAYGGIIGEFKTNDETGRKYVNTIKVGGVDVGYEYVSEAIFAPYNSNTTVTKLPAAKAINVKSTDKFEVNTATVDITKSNTDTDGYGVVLKKNPTLSTNAITIGSGTSAKTYKGFGNNFAIDSYNMLVKVNPRTTITFKASFGSNNLDKYGAYAVTNDFGGAKEIDFKSATFAAGSYGATLLSSFITNYQTYGTPSANVINVFKGVGAGKLTGFYFNGSSTTTALGTVTAGGDKKIKYDTDNVVQAVIEISLTPTEVTTYTFSEYKITAESIAPVVYDGRSHVIDDEDLETKSNYTSKIDDIGFNLIAQFAADGDGIADDNYVLTLNRDYKVSYKNNINANITYDANGNIQKTSKQPQIIVTGINNFKGLKLTLNFDIVANSLDEDDNITYNGKVYEDGVSPIIISDYIRIGNDKTGSVLKPKFQIIRNYQKNTAGDVATKKVTLGSKDIVASLYKADGTYVGPIKSAKAINTLATDEGQQYVIRATGIGNYQGTIEKDVYVFKKSSAKLLDNATPAWSKTLNKIKYSDNDTTLTRIVPSVKMKDKSTYTVVDNGGDKNVYLLKIVNTATGSSVYVNNDGEEINGDTVEDFDFVARKSGVHLLPGKYTATIVANENGPKDANGLLFVYGESKPKTFTVKAEKLPAVTFTSYVENSKIANWDAKMTDDSLAAATIETSGKSKEVNEKNRTLDYTGYRSYLDIKVGGGTYIEDTHYSVNLSPRDTDLVNNEYKTVLATPGTYTLTIYGERQFKGQKKKLVLKRKAMTMKAAMKDMDLDIFVAKAPTQNINGAFPDEDELYMTLYGETVSMNWNKMIDGNRVGTTRFTYEYTDDSRNTAILKVIHVVSQNEAHKGEKFEGVFQLKFSNNTKVGSKAKITVTGLAKYPSPISTWGLTDSFVTGGGLSTTYSIVPATILVDKVDVENTNIHPYDAIKVARGEEFIEPGEYYYTVEDVIENSKGTYKPKFKLYQAQQTRAVINTKKAIPVNNYSIEFSLSSNEPKNIKGLIGKLGAGNVTDNYKISTKTNATQTSGIIDIDGVYIYDKKVTLPKDGITLQTIPATLTDESARWLTTDEKGNLIYNYTGLNVNLGGSIKSLKLSAGKDDEVTIASTGATVNTAPDNAIQVIDLKPNFLAQTSGTYTATVRIKPDVVNSGKTASAAGTQYGGTVTIKFKVNDMSGIAL